MAKKGEKLGFVPKCAFKKGNIPWNTGTKGIKLPNSGSFKKGMKPWNWKEGTRYKVTGYIKLFKPEHPRADKTCHTVYEHILIMEEKIGRFITRDEQVHHINGIRDDNRIENLVLCKNQKEHYKHHPEAREKMREISNKEWKKKSENKK